jgi:pilus assembly protein Flp/PilA
MTNVQDKIEKLKSWRALRGDRRAVTALEYGLIAALIAVVIIGTVSALGSNVSSAFSNVSSAVGIANK